MTPGNSMGQKMPKITSGLRRIFGWNQKFGIGLTKILKSRPVFEGYVVEKVVTKLRPKWPSLNVVLLAKWYASSSLNSVLCIHLIYTRCGIVNLLVKSRTGAVINQVCTSLSVSHEVSRLTVFRMPCPEIFKSHLEGAQHWQTPAFGAQRCGST